MDERIEIHGGRPNRVSLEDVAVRAGVSKATVCRALRGKGRVSEATRERVRLLSVEMGYKPDPALSALTRYRWGEAVSGRARYSIALVQVDPTRTPHTQVRETAVEERARELNFLLEKYPLTDATTPRVLARMLYARGVDGIVFQISGPVFKWDFPWERFACVTIGFDGEAHRLNSVTSDWFTAVRMVAEQARKSGAERIGFANFFRGNPSMDERIQAATLLELKRNVETLGKQPPVLWYPKDRNLEKDTFRTERDGFLKWFEKHRPDVVVDGNRFAYWWLRDAGVRVPDEVGYVSLNAQCNGDNPTSGAVHQRERHARLAVDLLHNLIQSNERGLSDSPVRLTVRCPWHDGGTLRVTEPESLKSQSQTGS